MLHFFNETFGIGYWKHRIEFMRIANQAISICRTKINAEMKYCRNEEMKKGCRKIFPTPSSLFCYLSSLSCL